MGRPPPPRLSGRSRSHIFGLPTPSPAQILSRLALSIANGASPSGQFSLCHLSWFPISSRHYPAGVGCDQSPKRRRYHLPGNHRSEEHTSELQSQSNLVFLL